MSDIRTILVDNRGRFDWRMAGPSLEQDDGLITAICLSLFTDRRASEEQMLAVGDTDRRGWPGDRLVMPAGTEMGSLLWLLRGEKQTQQALNRAQGYAIEALKHLRDSGAALRIEVEAIAVRMGVMGLRVDVDAPRGRKERLLFEIASA